MSGILWLAFALVLVIVQFGIGTFDLLFFAFGALLTGLAAFLIPGFSGSWVWQILLWSASSLAGVFFLRKKLSRFFKGDEVKPGQDRLEHTGQKALVIEDISPGKPGRVKFHGTSWTGLSLDETIPAGAWVYVMEKQGMNYLVSQRLFLEDDQAMKEVEHLVKDVEIRADEQDRKPGE